MKYESLRPTFINQAAEKAKKQITDERSGEQYGLYSRFPKLNKLMLKYFRFNQITLLAGLSGAGKSTMLDYWSTDFTFTSPIRISKEKLPYSIVEHGLKRGDFYEDDKYMVKDPLNHNAKFKTIFASFSYEVPAQSQIIKKVSSITGIPFQYMLSADGRKTDLGEYIYNKVTDLEEQYFFGIIDLITKFKNTIYFEHSGNLKEFEVTMYQLRERYPIEKGYRLVCALDHTLLSNKLDERSDLELQNNTIKAAIRVRQETEALVILLGQFNNDIESTERKTNYGLHYPGRKDIYLGGQPYQGADNVVLLHRPDRIGIQTYGPHRLHTKNMLHLAGVKTRYGTPADIFLTVLPGTGKIIPGNPTDNSHLLI
jgi:hypothetical protein